MTLIRRFGACPEGVAATEFALMAPLLILLHFGTVEVVQALEAYRRVAHVSAAVADLTAENQVVSDSDLNDIMKAGGVLITPFSAASLGVRITSFTASSSGSVSQDWTTSSNWTANDSPSVPQGYLQAGESVIVADSSYSYQALFGFVLPKTLMMKTHAYLRPRLSPQVAHS
jgi:Flp pilus assembly protein TadG